MGCEKQVTIFVTCASYIMSCVTWYIVKIQTKIFPLLRRIPLASNYDYVLILAINNMNDKSCISTGRQFDCVFLTFTAFVNICCAH